MKILNKQFKMNWDYIILLGAIVVAFGTLKKSEASSKKQQELREQNEKLRNIVTGGDSYPKMVIYPGENDSFFVFIRNVGQYPLTHVEFWVMDMNGWDEMPQAEQIKRQIESQRTKQEIKYIGPGRQYGFEGRPFSFDRKTGAYLSVTFSANNGGNTEIIRAKYVKGNWLVAYKNMPDVKQPESIYEIPEGYPALPNKDDTFNNFY